MKISRDQKIRLKSKGKKDNSIENYVRKNKTKQPIEEVKKKVKNQYVQGSFTISSTLDTPHQCSFNNSKHKKKKKLHNPIRNLDKLEEQESIDIIQNESSQKKTDKHHGNQVKKRKKMLKLSREEYKPGMLSDGIQTKNYGHVIIPWDPSFGLDKSYRVPVIENKKLPKLKINPLFDMSKRKDVASQPLLGDKSQRSIFVGNLPGDIRDSEIKKLFRKCGKISQIKMRKISKKGNLDIKNHRNAVVTFIEAENCEKALKLNGKLFKDHHLRVDKHQNSSKQGSKRSVFVGNLAFRMEDEDLWEAFQSCGEIEDVRIIRDLSTGRGKGFGYVNFKTEDAVEKALKLDGQSILERDIRVRRSETGEHSSIVKEKKKKKKKKKPALRGNNDTTDESKPKQIDDVENNNFKKLKAMNELKEKKIKKKISEKKKFRHNAPSHKKDNIEDSD